MVVADADGRDAAGQHDQLAAVEGVAAVWLADAANVGAGPAFAVLGAAVFAAVAVWQAVAR